MFYYSLLRELKDGVTRGHIFELMNRFYTSGDLVSAEAVFKGISEFDLTPDREITALMLRIYSLYGDQEGADKMLSTMITEGYQPTVHDYNLFLKTIVLNQFSDDLNALVKLMKCNNVQPNAETFSFLAVGYFASQDIVKLTEVVDMTRARFPKYKGRNKMEELQNKLKRILLL